MLEHPSILRSLFPRHLFAPHILISCRNSCSGHPYAELFETAQKIGPYENAETSSEESLSEPSEDDED